MLGSLYRDKHLESRIKALKELKQKTLREKSKITQEKISDSRAKTKRNDYFYPRMYLVTRLHIYVQSMYSVRI